MYPEIYIDTKSVESLVARLSIDPKDQGRAIYKGFVNACLVIERALKGNLSGALLRVRSGRLRSSIGSRVDTEEAGLVGRIGSGVRQGERVRYATIQELGGTIRPRLKQFLTIPLDAAKTASGVARGKARDFDDTFIQKSTSGNLIIFQNKGRNGIVPLFALKKSVDIPASKYLSITAQEISKDANQALHNAINEELKE